MARIGKGGACLVISNNTLFLKYNETCTQFFRQSDGVIFDETALRCFGSTLIGTSYVVTSRLCTVEEAGSTALLRGPVAPVLATKVLGTSQPNDCKNTTITAANAILCAGSLGAPLLVVPSITCNTTGEITTLSGGFAKYDCNESTLVYTGYGFRNNDALYLDGHLTSFVASIPTILVHPPIQGKEAEFELHGVGIINITEFTGIFGGAVERSIVHRPIRPRTAYVVGNVVFFVLNILAVVLFAGAPLVRSRM